MKTLQANPYNAAIADVEMRIQELQTTLSVLKRLRDEAPAGRSSARAEIVLSQGGPVEVLPNAFAGMTIAEAARKYLGIVMQPKTIDEIAQALERGGLDHASIDFHTTLRTTLAKHDYFMRINNMWVLTEWHREIAGKSPKKLTLEQKVVKAMGTEPGSVWLPRRMALAIHANLNSVQSMMSAMAQDGRLHKEPRGYSLNKPKPVVVPKPADVA